MWIFGLTVVLTGQKVSVIQTLRISGMGHISLLWPYINSPVFLDQCWIISGRCTDTKFYTAEFLA